MKLSINYCLFACLLVFGLSASAQTPADAKQFTKDGLSFSYPSAWAFNDTSNTDAQQMTFGRTDSDAQITVFVFRAPLTTPERLAEAKRVLVDKYIASTTKSFEEAGARPESAPTSTEIGTVKSDGVKIRASLDGVPGVAEIHSAVVGQRLVVLTFLGPDKALVKAAPAWDMIRTSIKVEEPQPKIEPKAQPTVQPPVKPRSNQLPARNRERRDQFDVR
ncbi:MAG TPA: hypothetical protein VMZ30_01725 [Pyrinomonadaceae bacterium]|nr:hypothetical protein [Pyrinomonadaceae bacterium]